MKRSTWKADELAVVNARRVLPGMVRDYFAAGRKLDRGSGARDMHGFRLKTKHLRYTLETFVSLYGPGLNRRIEGLRPIQNALGELNDCQVLLAEMGGLLPREAHAYLTRRADEKRKEFLRYWREVFDAADEDKKWEEYLARHTRARRTKAGVAKST